MLNENKWAQFGQPRTESVKGITIHNTGSDLSAEELEKVMEESVNHLATHFFVDEIEVIQMMPLDWAVWHTGKGFDMGNMRTIAIEICRSTSDEEVYLKAQANAIKLIKSLLKEYGLTKNDIYFHSNFDSIYCPHRILDKYKTRENFIKEMFK